MKVITYLSFAGQCEEALNFYKNVLGGEISFISRMGESPMDVPANLKNKIMHATLKIGEIELFMSDTFDPSSIKQGNNLSLAINISNTTKAEDLFNKLSAGGTVKMPLEKTYWAERFGMLIDKFGIHWMINCENK